MGQAVAAAIALKRQRRREAGIPDYWGRKPLLCKWTNGAEVLAWIERERDTIGRSWSSIATALELTPSTVRRMYWQGRDWLNKQPETVSSEPAQRAPTEPTEDHREGPTAAPADSALSRPTICPVTANGGRTRAGAWCSDQACKFGDSTCPSGCVICGSCHNFSSACIGIKGRREGP
jgi:hypothetical protein